MEQKKEKKKGSLALLLPIALGVCLGVALSNSIDCFLPEDLPDDGWLPMYAGMCLLFFAAVYVQIILHEGGHLIFGLLSGYRFVSFRIGSLQLSKVGGKLRLGRFSIAGTGGQCLMAPPDLVNGKLPVIAYNLGGVVMNFLSGAVALTLLLILQVKGIFGFCLLSLAINGFFMALTNGIPLKLNMVENDGRNALSLGKNPVALRAFWLQLKVNAEIAAGKRLKDMPEEWFVLPDETDMRNSMVSSVAVLCCSRLLDQGRYADADALMEHLLKGNNNIVGLHKSLMICDRMSCEMLGQNRRGLVVEMRTKEVDNFMRAMKKYPSVIRTEYLYALLVENNLIKCQELLEKFEKIEKNYPYSNDMMADREMIAAAQRICESEEKAHGEI